MSLLRDDWDDAVHRSPYPQIQVSHTSVEMRTTDVIHPPFNARTSRSDSWASSSSSSPSDDLEHALRLPLRTFSTYSSTLAALARPGAREDAEFQAEVINSYVNAKLGRSRDVYKSSKKLDLLERNLLALEIPTLASVIARSRRLHGMPITNPSLPSSWMSDGPRSKDGVTIQGNRGSTIVFAF